MDHYEIFLLLPTKSAVVAAPPNLGSIYLDILTLVVGRRKVKAAGAYVFMRRRIFLLRVTPLAAPN
jgi:hypothetical protein